MTLIRVGACPVLMHTNGLSQLATTFEQQQQQNFLFFVALEA